VVMMPWDMRRRRLEGVVGGRSVGGGGGLVGIGGRKLVSGIVSFSLLSVVIGLCFVDLLIFDVLGLAEGGVLIRVLKKPLQGWLGARETLGEGYDCDGLCVKRGDDSMFALSDYGGTVAVLHDFRVGMIGVVIPGVFHRLMILSACFRASILLLLSRC